MRERRGLEVLLVAVLTGACIFLTIWFHYVSDVGIVFPNLYYVPIVLACLWWGRKGIALAAFLAALLVISSALSPGTQPLWDDLVRAAIFLVIAVVIAELSADRRRLIDTLEGQVRERTAELRARNEELDTFSRTVSHDLIATLSTLHGYVEVVRDAVASGNTALEMEGIDTIGSLSLRMSHSIEELLDYARAGRHEGAARPVDPARAAGDVVEDIAGLISSGNVEISIDEMLPRVLVEEVKLKQVFSNLITNAIRHGAGDGPLRIDIGGFVEDDTATLFVSDDGVGIEKEWQVEVFEEFKRLNPGEEKPGLGLGLSIVKRAVEGWGGRVWLESAPGAGCTFFFTAPLAA